MRTLPFLAVLISCTPTEEEPADTTPQLDFSEFDATVDAFLADEGLDGATAAVVHKDHGVLHMRGYGDFDVDRIMLLASASKQITAGVLLHLDDEGLLDLDAPISDTLSDWGAYKTDITTAQLLSNSSGLMSLADDATYAPYLCQYIAAGSLSACAEAIYSADDDADRIPPDTQFKYGGGQWQLAGGIAEVASGKTWETLIDEVYVEPCGLENTGYANHFGRAAATNAFGYPPFMDGDPDVLEDTDNPNMEGGGYSTVSDYAKLLMMQLNDGRCGDVQVISAENIAYSRSNRIGDVYDGTTGFGALPGYGLGWWLDTDRAGWAVDAGAYGTVPWIDEPNDYAVVVMLEADNATGGRLQRRVEDIVQDLITGSDEL